MNRETISWCSAALMLLFACSTERSGQAQADEGTPLFFMAGQLNNALRESTKRGRPMLIKGVGQIVDPVAAKDINKGE